MPGEDQNQFLNHDQMLFAPGSIVAHTLWPVASRRSRDGNFRRCLKQLMQPILQQDGGQKSIVN